VDRGVDRATPERDRSLNGGTTGFERRTASAVMEDGERSHV
jgi:hypothetical protein